MIFDAETDVIRIYIFSKKKNYKKARGSRIVGRRIGTHHDEEVLQNSKVTRIRSFLLTDRMQCILYKNLSWLYIEHISFQVRVSIFVFVLFVIFFTFSNPELFFITKKERCTSLRSACLAKKEPKALELKLYCFEEYGKETCRNAHVQRRCFRLLV